jgi:hypothetical protein
MTCCRIDTTLLGASLACSYACLSRATRGGPRQARLTSGLPSEGEMT